MGKKYIFNIINHYAPGSQANWFNMTFTASNVLSLISVTLVKPPLGFEAGPMQLSPHPSIWKSVSYEQTFLLKISH